MRLAPFVLILGSFLLPCIASGQGGDSFIRGGDISTTPQIEDAGGTYKLNGVAQDLLDIVRIEGMNWARLRLWHTPAKGYCGLPSTVAYAQRIKAKGLKFLLDFHYSDSWADPGKQTKPAAWSSISYDALKDSVYTYTRDVLEALRNHGATPDMVQIGNEITGGMLWPDGKIGNVSNPTQAWIQFGDLVKQGIRGARDGALDSTLAIMIHIDRGGDNATSRWFFDNLIAQGVQFDVIGQSYYPWWHGTFTQLKNNLNDLAVRYNKPIVVAETAYPWTTQSVNDGVGNVGVNSANLPAGYSISVAGQKAFLSTLTDILKETSNGKGAGFIYWEPAWISVPTVGSSWEHLATFDFSGQALNSMTSFMDFDTIPTVKVTARFNTSTNPDTLKPDGFVQVRGEVRGLGSGFLPNGKLLTWDSYSQIISRNLGGDYWGDTLRIYRSDTLLLKLWTGHTSAVATYLRLGWEGPVTPYDSSGLNGRMVVGGAADTSLPTEYFNPTGDYVGQYWSPFRKTFDSLGVRFRVNLIDLMNKGQFNPSIHGPVVVRGDSAMSAGMLSWTKDNLILQRESLTVGGGSFWSGIAYFPKSLIAPGTPIQYSFFVKNSSFDGTESSIEKRTFSFPVNDTTLAWRFFNERGVLTSAEIHREELPTRFQLFQNYPNPFNPLTIIKYTVGGNRSVPSNSSTGRDSRSASGGPEGWGLGVRDVSLVIYDVLGRKVAVLVNERKAAGSYEVTFDGSRLASGIYVYRLRAGTFVEARKMVLAK